MKPLSCILVLLFYFQNASAQNRHSFELSGDYGYIIMHSQAIRPIGKSNPFAFSGEYSLWLLGEENWSDCHCFPRMGVNVSYLNFDNPEVLGFALPVSGFLEPWFPLMPGVFFTLRGAVGYAYTSKPYNELSNPDNLSYSLYFNPIVQVGTGLAFRINDNWRAGVQARYNHISNGGLEKPNKGVNYPTANLSLSYSPSAIQFNKRKKVPLAELNMRKSLISSAFISGAAAGENDLTYAIPGLALRYSHQFGRTSAWVVGTEWINNLAYGKKIKDEGLDASHQQITLLAGHEFLLGNFTFSQMAGIYLHREYDITPDWYQRYGLEWYFLDNFALGTAIKVHGHVAEFLDFRISYRYNFEAD